MPFVFLTHYENFAGKEIEIVVSYGTGDAALHGISKISISKPDILTMPVTELFRGIPELWEAICLIVDRVDWTSIYLNPTK